MYQAIVFLPLLGAIIAGIITLAGARKRFPGGEAPVGAEDHTDDTGPHTVAAHVHGDAGVIHASSHEDEHHEPAAEGSRPAELVTSGFLVVAALLSWVAFFSFWFGGATPQRIPVFNWFASGTLAVDWALRIDTLTVVMLVVVNTVSALVHIYSIGYLAHDPYRPRFFAYLSMFTFAMLALATSDNLVQLFFGWEGVGLASYLLIGFWYTRPSANAAAIKAFVVNRVGDFGFALGILGVWYVFRTLDFDAVFAAAPSMVGKNFVLAGHNVDILTTLCLLLFIGAMGKSAQLGLHTWLPDAMEGPTPVSALIHAATMVNAGVYLVARTSPIFAHTPEIMVVVAALGTFTAILAASIAFTQTDIKRVLAYSTLSQLGYMFAALGVGAWTAAIFHLMAHGFFKGLLFLDSGSVIHAVHDEQDMRKMGGLSKKIPITYWTILIGSIAISGIPPLAGFFSKDEILGEAFKNGFLWVWAIGFLVAGMTAFYMFRLIGLTFWGESRVDPAVEPNIHESGRAMTIPLILLAIPTIFIGLFLGLPFGASRLQGWLA